MLLAVQLSALVVLQVRVSLPPAVTEGALAESMRVGAGVVGVVPPPPPPPLDGGV